MLTRAFSGRLSLVSLFGGVLLVLLGAQSAVDTDPFSIDVFETAVPVVLGLSVGFIDGWMYRQGFDPGERARSFKYMVVGLAVLTGLAVWLAILQRMNGTRLGELGFVVIGAATVGAAAGLVIGVARIRQRRAIDSLEQQREELESFANTVSHDLRNPLNVALAKLDDIEAEVDHEQVDRVESTLRRMDDILEGTLAVARQGSIVREPEPVDLATVARDAWADVDTIEATLDLGELGTVAGDEGRLYQLFENLFRNAVEHAGTTTSVTVGTLPDGFYVEDDGPGIPASIRDRVTERGFTAKPDGSGLGLAIVRAIAVAHGWEIVVTDGKNDGARIEFRGVG